MTDSLKKERSNQKGAEQTTGASGALSLHSAAKSNWKDWLGLIPFFLFIFAFMVIPAGSLLVGAFQNRDALLLL